MRRSYTVILMALLSLITTEAANMMHALNCGKEEYNRCITLADPLVKDPHFIYPGNLKDIDNICRTWTLFVDCTSRYTERCFEESKRKIFNKAVENSLELVNQMCTSRQYQTEYLKHASCLRSTLFDDSRCGKHYRSLAGFISNETSGPSICCAHYRFRECVLDQTRRTCNPDDDTFTQQLLDKSFGFFSNQCIDFEPNKDECPGHDYYNSMTTNRWQDDKEKESSHPNLPRPGSSNSSPPRPGSPHSSPRPSPDPSSWSSTKRQDDWMPDQNNNNHNGWSGGPSTASSNERTSRGHPVQGSPFSTPMTWQTSSTGGSVSAPIQTTTKRQQQESTGYMNNMIDEPNQQGLAQNGAGSAPKTVVLTVAVPALMALAGIVF